MVVHPWAQEFLYRAIYSYFYACSDKQFFAFSRHAGTNLGNRPEHRKVAIPQSNRTWSLKVSHRSSLIFENMCMCTSQCNHTINIISQNLVHICFRRYVCPSQRHNPKLSRLGNNKASADTSRRVASASDDARSYQLRHMCLL